MKYGQMDRAWRYGREKQDGVESSGKKKQKQRGREGTWEKKINEKRRQEKRLRISTGYSQ